jgi:hypothetical protein
MRLNMEFLWLRNRESPLKVLLDFHQQLHRQVVQVRGLAQVPALVGGIHLRTSLALGGGALHMILIFQGSMGVVHHVLLLVREAGCLMDLQEEGGEWGHLAPQVFPPMQQLDVFLPLGQGL